MPVALVVLLLSCHCGSATLSFGPPVVIAPVLWPYGFVGLDSASGQRLAVGSLAGAFQSSAGSTWTTHHLPGSFGQALPSQCAMPCRTLTTFGVFAPQLSGTDTAEAFNATGSLTWTVGADGTPHARADGVVMQFRGFPRPIASGHFSKGGVRLGGTASVRLPSGTLLQTLIVTFAGQEHSQYPDATSLLLFRSVDGKQWDYLATIAEASTCPFSHEGPNEMDLALLPNGTLLAVIRMDAGDGIGHPYLDYYQSASADGGCTWSVPVPMPGLGCARPRLMRVGPALILAGGRLRNAGTSDILLWVSEDASARAWTEYSVSYHHNVGMHNTSLRFDSNVNSTTFSPRETNSYTSLIPLNDRRFVITYDMHKIDGNTGEFSFSMEVSF